MKDGLTRVSAAKSQSVKPTPMEIGPVDTGEGEEDYNVDVMANGKSKGKGKSCYNCGQFATTCSNVLQLAANCYNSIHVV